MVMQESDSLVVSPEAGEPKPKGTRWREGVSGNKKLQGGKMPETLSSVNISTRLEQIAKSARGNPKRVFTSIGHVIDYDWMQEAYRRTRKDSAAGVDGQDADGFTQNLEVNLRDLVKALQTGNYKAPPVRRVHIPKADGKLRPIGIPTFADKVMQRAVVMLLEAIYEVDFHPHSYGFRRKRSAHDALKEIQKRPTYWQYCHVIEADIESFFDTIDHKHLRSFLDRRVRDGVIRRAIDKWLSAGVFEEGQIFSIQNGTPQGGVISPLLANIYLHEVLDSWFERDVFPRIKRRAQLIRYADDFVLLFGWEEDARKVYEVLPKRFGRYGLKLHPMKTQMVPFSSPFTRRGRKMKKKSGTFDFLGFTQYWAKSRNGNYIVKQTTSKTRFSRSLKRIREQCHKMMHDSLKQQQKILTRMLQGHYNYFGITGNGDALRNLRHEVDRIWGRALARRNKRRFAWQRFQPILKLYPLPPAKTVHSICPSEF